MLFLDGKTVALANSCTLNVSRAMDESSSKDDGPYRTVTPGDIQWSVSSDSLFSPDVTSEEDPQISFMDMLLALIEGKELTMVYTIVGNPTSLGIPTDGWKPKDGTGVTGKVFVDATNATGAKGSAASASLSFTGNGALTQVSTTAAQANTEAE